MITFSLRWLSLWVTRNNRYSPEFSNLLEIVDNQFAQKVRFEKQSTIYTSWSNICTSLRVYLVYLRYMAYKWAGRSNALHFVLNHFSQHSIHNRNATTPSPGAPQIERWRNLTATEGTVENVSCSFNSTASRVFLFFFVPCSSSVSSPPQITFRKRARSCACGEVVALSHPIDFYLNIKLYNHDRFFRFLCFFVVSTLSSDRRSRSTG